MISYIQGERTHSKAPHLPMFKVPVLGSYDEVREGEGEGEGEGGGEEGGRECGRAGWEGGMEGGRPKEREVQCVSARMHTPCVSPRVHAQEGTRALASAHT